ncbi:MAG: uroporphyrinogen decarboxylase family protein [Planctomycetota bacterium]
MRRGPEKVSPRERFLHAMRFEAVDRLPILTHAPWDDTLTRWKKEGMESLEAEFAPFDGPMQSCWLYAGHQGPIPPFEEKVVAETQEYQDKQNYIGQIRRNIIGHTSIPYFLRYPVQSRKDWESYKRRLDPYSPGRYPQDWDAVVQARKAADAGEICGVAVWGFYGFPRELLGPVQLSYMYYDDPALIAEMNEVWVHYTMKRLQKGLKEMAFDYVLIWEDNCYNHGMLHSPQVFKEFMAPYYRILIEFLHKNGIEIISVDSDGNIAEFIPLLLDVGVTAIHPFEVAAGMDVVEIGREYPRLQIWGGIDKRALSRGPQAIDQELKRVLPAMKRRGGYAAGLDHGIPSDVSLENHRHYVKRLLEWS